MTKILNALRFIMCDRFVFKVCLDDYQWQTLMDTLQGIPTHSQITSLVYDEIAITKEMMDIMINNQYDLKMQIDLIDKFYGCLCSLKYQGSVEFFPDNLIEMRNPQALPYNGSQKFNPDLLTIKEIRLGFKIV